MTRYSTDKHINQLIQHLVSQGWFFEKRKKHNAIWSPTKEQRVFFACSPSDRRAYQNLRSHIRHLGFDVPRI